MKLTANQQANLITAADGGVDSINAMVEKLRQEWPTAFHTDTSLLTRVFFHKPAGETPCRSFVRNSVQR
jgi:hypothetical protein